MYKIFIISALLIGLGVFLPGEVLAEKFTDVDQSAPYAQAISYLAEKGIIQGYPDGSFQPARTLNRAELLTLLVRSQYQAEDYMNIKSCFDDVLEKWYAGTVCFAFKKGWVQGYADGLFHPGQLVNKAEALKMIFKTLQIPIELEQAGFYFDDVPLTAWFADEISYAKRYGFVDESGKQFYPEAQLSRGYFSEILNRILTRDYAVLSPPVRNRLAILASAEVFPELSENITKFGRALAQNGKYEVHLKVEDWKSVADVRFLLQELYWEKGIQGAILIGDVPLAHFGNAGESAIVSDWYYQDLDNTLIADINSDNVFDKQIYSSLNPISDREIWTSRITLPRDVKDDVELIGSFLEKFQIYLNEPSAYRKEMLVFDSITVNQFDDSAKAFDALSYYYGDDLLYDQRSKIEMVYHENIEDQKSIFLNRLKDSFELNLININGGLTSHWLGNDVIVSEPEIQQIKPAGLFYDLLSASNGNFGENDYLAAWYLFSGQALAVSALSAALDEPDEGRVIAAADRIAMLNYGVNIGEMIRNDTRFLVPQLFGIGVFSLRASDLSAEVSQQPKFMAKKLSIDFGSILVEEDSILPIFLKNGGGDDLYISIKALESIFDSKPIVMGSKPFYLYGGPDSFDPQRPGWVKIKAGEKLQLPIAFDPSTVGLLGVYEGRMILYTNDRNNPYVRLYFRGKAL